MSRKSRDISESPMRSGPRRMSISIEEAENGAIIHAHGEGKNGEYTSKNHIAPDSHTALRIANTHLSSVFGKRRGKKTKSKKSGPAKIAFSK